MRRLLLTLPLLIACERQPPPPRPVAPPPVAPAAAELPAAATPADVTTTVDLGPLPEFSSLDAMAAKWQGAWLMQAAAGGPRQAWQVHGHVVDSDDGKTRLTRTFHVLSPCSVEIASGSGPGRSGAILAFGFDGEQLYAGLGSAGFRKGGAVVACQGSQVYAWKAGACTLWTADVNGNWNSRKAECGPKKQGGAETFELRDPDHPDAPAEVLLAYGDGAYFSETMRAHPAEKVASLAEGRAKLGR